jgi:hypothetical protein
VKLIEEFNNLQNEHKKLNDLRIMIKESIKDILGDDCKDENINSSDEESFKKKQKLKQQQMM